MSVPDVALPFGLALPAIDRAFVLTMLLAALLGGLAVDVLLTLRPFSTHRPSHVGSLLGLMMLIGGCLVFGAFAARGQTPLVVAAVAAALGAFAYWWAHRKIVAEPDVAGLLTDADLRRAKTRSDRWVLVTGLAGSGKTTLVEEMIASASSRLAGPVCSAEDGKLRATEVAVHDRRGGSAMLRLWEAPSIDRGRGRLPALDDFDAVVLTIDPVQHSPIADSFPETLRGGRAPADANESVLQLAGALRGDCLLWAVATKSDLLRFSVHPGLLGLPLQPGPGWYRQVQSMDVMTRRELAETLSLDQLTREPPASFRVGVRQPGVCVSGKRSRTPTLRRRGPDGWNPRRAVARRDVVTEDSPDAGDVESSRLRELQATCGRGPGSRPRSTSSIAAASAARPKTARREMASQSTPKRRRQHHRKPCTAERSTCSTS